MASQPVTNKLKVANPSIENNVRTYLTADITAGDSTFTIVNNAGFVGENFYVMIGEYGDEKAEIKMVTSFNGNTFNVVALLNSHEASDPVTLMEYNQIRFYGMTTAVEPLPGDSPLMSVDIDCSQLYTQYTYEGLDYSYFCTTYYNEVSDEMSGFSEIISNISFTRKSVKRIIESALRKAMAKIDETIEGDLNWDNALDIVGDGIDEILTKKRRWPFLRTIKSDTYTTANIEYIAKPTDLSMLEFLIVNNKVLTLLTRSDYNNYVYNNVTVTTGEPEYFIEKNNKYYLFPKPGAIYPVIYEYFKVPATIATDLSTEVDLAFVPMLIHYCAAHFAWLQGNDKRGDKMYQLFQKMLDDQIIEFSGPEQTGQAEQTEQISVYNYDDIN
jgi:hypothetical protein